MVRPRPVPPYLRVVEPSAWEKASKIAPCPGPGRGPAGRRRPPFGGPRGGVKGKVLPLPASLSPKIRPPIGGASGEEMVSPSPSPPYLRVVEPSAWEKASKIAPCRAG